MEASRQKKGGQTEVHVAAHNLTRNGGEEPGPRGGGGSRRRPGRVKE